MAGKNAGRTTDPKQTVQRKMEDQRGFANQADLREGQRAPQRLETTGNSINDFVGPLRIKNDVTITEGLLKVEIVNDDVDGLQVGPIIDPAFPSGPALYFIRTIASSEYEFFITNVGSFPMFRVLPNDNLVQLQRGAALEFYDNATNALAGTISSLETEVDVTGTWIFTGPVTFADVTVADIDATGAVAIVRDGTLTFQVQKADLTKIFVVDTTNNRVALWNGADLLIYSDTGSTVKASIDGATGDIVTVGDLTVDDITASGVVQISETSTAALWVRKADTTTLLALDTTNSQLELWNATDLTMYSGNGSTLVAEIDGATGAFTQDSQATPATPASGFATIYPNTSNVYEAVDPNGDVWSVGKVQTVKKGSDQTISTTTLTTVTSMSFNLRANRVYFFEYFLIHQSAATTTGLKLAINVATATVTEITYTTEIIVTNTANGTANVQVQSHTANNSTHTAATQAAANTSTVAKVTGSIVVGGTGGTLNLQFAGDAAANITAKTGSYGRMWF